MVFYIRQTEGTKAQAAQELIEARKAGDYKRMAQVYVKECGKLNEAQAQEIRTGNLCFWVYNAPEAIRANHAVFQQANKKYGRAILTEQRWAFEKMARMAENKHGGKWEVVYEY